MDKYYLRKKVVGKLREIVEILYGETKRKERENRQLQESVESLRNRHSNLVERCHKADERLDLLQAMIRLSRNKKTKKYTFTFTFNESVFAEIRHEASRRIGHIGSAIGKAAEHQLGEELKRIRESEAEQARIKRVVDKAVKQVKRERRKSLVSILEASDDLDASETEMGGGT